MAMLEIGDETIRALSKSVRTVDERQLEALGRAALSVVLGVEREEEALLGPPFEDLDVDVIKSAYSALVCLFLEAAKNDLSGSEVVLFLKTECGFDETLAELVARLFSDKKDDLRGLLAHTANHSYLPSLTGVEWKLEYCMPATDMPSVRELLYRVCFNTINRENGKDEKFEFVASLDELQDLVNSMKDACKSVERAVQR